MNSNQSHFDNESKIILVKNRKAAYADAFAKLKPLLAPDLDYPQLCKMVSLFAKMPVQDLGLTPIKLVILSTSTIAELSSD